MGLDERLKETIQSYDSTVLEYFKNTVGLHPGAAARSFWEKLPTNAKVLDHGCGPGRDAKLFSDSYHLRVTGFDLAPKMIRFARDYAPRAKFCVADMRSLPFEDECFDGVWSVASVLSIPKSDGAGAISEAARVLKRGGVLYLRLKQGVGETFSLDNRYDPPVRKLFSYYLPDEISGILEGSGFAVEELESKSSGSEYQKNTELNIFSRKR